MSHALPSRRKLFASTATPTSPWMQSLTNKSHWCTSRNSTIRLIHISFLRRTSMLTTIGYALMCGADLRRTANGSRVTSRVNSGGSQLTGPKRIWNAVGMQALFCRAALRRRVCIRNTTCTCGVIMEMGTERVRNRRHASPRKPPPRLSAHAQPSENKMLRSDGPRLDSKLNTGPTCRRFTRQNLL